MEKSTSNNNKAGRTGTGGKAGQRRGAAGGMRRGTASEVNNTKSSLGTEIENTVEKEVEKIEKGVEKEWKKAENFFEGNEDNDKNQQSDDVEPGEGAEHLHSHVYGNDKYRWVCVGVAGCVVVGCAVFEYFFNHEKYCELAQNNAAMAASIKEYQEKIGILGERVESLEKTVIMMGEKGFSRSSSAAEARSKWEVWCSLKAKLESGDGFEAELKKFEETFAKDADLVKMVKDAIRESEPEAKIDDDAVVGAVKKYINKVVSIRKISTGKLIEISGYVLLSIGK